MIRNAQAQDAKGLYRLAQLLNTTNLPSELKGVEEIIERSCRSFEGDSLDPLYLFVLEDTQTKQVIGTSQIIARHGTLELPHIFFQLETQRFYSQSLKEGHLHRVLRLGFDVEGYTELGGLVLDPSYRHAPYRLGRALSLVRFWFIRQFPERFQARLLAELLPPNASEESPLWKAFGSRFSKLSYEKADHLSRRQKEFIETLFPREPIYVTLLPKEAQEVLGQVGEGSRPAWYLLTKLGFEFQNRIDPFDGGPHLEMLAQDLPPVNLGWEIQSKDLFVPKAQFSLLFPEASSV